MNKMPIDLNLLVVFDALMLERSVTRAGRRIGLSQPAMSHALSRLRYMLKDRLFVRTTEGMVPTPRAEKLGPLLRNALTELRFGMEPEQFEPAASDLLFTLAVNNYSAIVLGPPLSVAVSMAAPMIRLNIRPSGTSDILSGLERGDFDLALGSASGPSDRFQSTPLLEDRRVLVMRRGHPASRRKLSAIAFAALSHLEISSSYEDTGFIDAWLGKQGLVRRIVRQMPNLAVPTVLAQSDLVTTMSRRVALEMVRHNSLAVRELPCVSPTVQTLMLWHLRLDSQPAHRWLRDVILSLTKRLHGR